MEHHVQLRKDTTEKIYERLDKLDRCIHSEEFVKTSGTTNTVNHWVFDYNPKHELIVRERVNLIQKKYNDYHDELKIYDYNRVIKDMNGLTSEELFEELDSVAELISSSKEPIRPNKKGQWSMFLDETWHLYQVREELLSDDPVDGLDVALLQNLVLEPLFGIDDPKTSDRIDFVGGIRGLEELERRCAMDCKVAFAMHPTSISELFKVADAGLLMPPKSTWFEPKLRSGLFIHQI